MDNIIDIHISFDKQNFKLTETYIQDLDKDSVVNYLDYQTHNNFVFEKNSNLENIFNQSNILNSGSINFKLHVKNQNLDSCIKILNKKIKQVFKENFQYEINKINIADNRIFNEYNAKFEEYIDNFKVTQTENENFSNLKKEDITKFLEYTNKKINAYQELSKKSINNITHWMRINSEEKHLMRMTEQLVTHLENNVEKPEFMKAIKKFKL